jgi:hypothetical protein
MLKSSNSGHKNHRLVTAVIGAGPAGSMFCFVSRLLAIKSQIPPKIWRIILLDKRNEYQRSHRLVIDRKVYKSCQKEMNDQIFDSLIEFLEKNSFAPRVNELETFLSLAISQLGVEKRVLTLGNSPGDTSFAALRKDFEENQLIDSEDLLTIVGADSVHSTVRTTLGPRLVLEHSTHEHLARFLVRGRAIPEKIHAFERYRLAKILGSVVMYYPKNSENAEVDLFLSAKEFQVISSLGANPKTPVFLNLKDPLFRDAPFLKRILQQLSRGLSDDPCEVFLISTFQLEHAVCPTRVFKMPEINAFAFLVGDAAIALPFQRGMAALLKSVSSLASAHLNLLRSPSTVEKIAFDYDKAVGKIVEEELNIVRARAKLVRGLKEFFRISAILPFPIQSWFLSHEDRAEKWEALSSWRVINFICAVSAFCIAFGKNDAHSIGWMMLLGLFSQTLGGFLYRATLEYERPPFRTLKSIWAIQISAWFITGTYKMLSEPSKSFGSSEMLYGTIWWFGGIFFIFGIYAFEFLSTRWWKSGDWTD